MQRRRATAFQTRVSDCLPSGKVCLERGGMLSIGREDTLILISHRAHENCAYTGTLSSSQCPAAQLICSLVPLGRCLQNPGVGITGKKTMEKSRENK